ncbi:glycerol channel [Savitreella phatthalungensis]
MSDLEAAYKRKPQATLSQPDLHREHGFEHFSVHSTKPHRTVNPEMVTASRRELLQDSYVPKFLQLQREGPSREAHKIDKTRDLTYLARARRYLREPLAEFLGTAILVIFGDGSVCQVRISEILNPAASLGNYTSIGISWALGVLVAIVVAGNTSGAHLNPSVTLANALFRRFPWKKLPIYILAQMLGGIVGSAIVFGLYHPAIRQVEDGDALTLRTAGYFSTFAQPYLGKSTQILSEVNSTALLIIAIFAAGDEANGFGQTAPFLIALTVMAIGMALGFNTGYALNAARDTGPRILMSMVGYPGTIWSEYGFYSLTILWTPLLGAIVGGLVYDILVFTGDSPLNRPYFGFYEWRWRTHGMQAAEAVGDAMGDAVQAVAEALPEAIVPDALLNDSDGTSTRSTTASTTEAELRDKPMVPGVASPNDAAAKQNIRQNSQTATTTTTKAEHTHDEGAPTVRRTATSSSQPTGAGGGDVKKTDSAAESGEKSTNPLAKYRPTALPPHLMVDEATMERLASDSEVPTLSSTKVKTP